ncbi:MAG TPA: hypothetical protein VKA10_11495, partial [Prolixibacteraceae bacterium]|nr:hypothetical protein [Prolixibacteraceae bacterium]
DPIAANLKNKVAVMRGPVVYCLELPKNEGGKEIFNKGIFFPENITLTPKYRDDFLSGVTVLKGTALTQKEKEDFVKNIPTDSEETAEQWAENELYRPMKTDGNNIQEANGSVEIELIPYYAWANRGLSYMDVWIPLAN